MLFTSFSLCLIVSACKLRLKKTVHQPRPWLALVSKLTPTLLGKLSFVTVRVKSGRIFMSRLLNNLRAFPSSRWTAVVSHDMKLDIDWWLTFLPLFNGVSFIKSEVWSFDDFHFSTNACLSGGGATCQHQCFSVVFPPNILQEATHITALELFVVVVAIRAWAPLLAHHPATTKRRSQS